MAARPPRRPWVASSTEGWSFHGCAASSTAMGGGLRLCPLLLKEIRCAKKREERRKNLEEEQRLEEEEKRNRFSHFCSGIYFIEEHGDFRNNIVIGDNSKLRPRANFSFFLARKKLQCRAHNPNCFAYFQARRKE